MKGVSVSIVVLCSFLSISAEEVSIQVQKSTAITFPSQNHRAYKLLATEDPSASWRVLKDGIAGTGGDVTIFYKSETDQKLFFKIETSDGPPGQRSLQSLAGLDLSNKDLTSYDLEGMDLRGYKFFQAVLDKADLAGADLRTTTFDDASLKGADLRGVILDNTGLARVNFQGANLSGLVFTAYNSSPAGADFRGANLTGTRFEGSLLNGATFAGNDLANAYFQGSSFYESDLTGCNLTGANLSRTLFYYAKIAGTVFTGANLEGTRIAGASVAGLDLHTINLRGATIDSGNWSGVNLAGVDLTVASLWNQFGGANFSGGNLMGLTAEALPLSQCNFRNANLTGASFRNSDLANCDFTGANLSFADFAGADLTGSTGFDAEQPGMQFGPRPRVAPGPLPSSDPREQGTVLPDRTVRNGVNPGTPSAPATVPPRIVLKVDDSGAKYTLDLAFAGDQFSQGVGGPNLGKFTYSARPTLATLKLIYTVTDVQTYTLLFDSPKVGKLFYWGNNRGIYLIGTFQIP